MDVLGCLGFTEQVAVAVTIVLLFAAWRFGTRRGAGKSQTWLRTELIVWALFAGVAAAYVGVALLVGRPMALLEVQDPDTAVADFHSHTSRSHDGRHGFTAERNRAWHAAAGFDVAYITDHHVWGRYRNPRTAGDGTVLLSGAELRLAHAHILVLGDADRYADLVDTRPRRLLPERFVCVESTPPPVVIIPLPVVPERIAPLVRAACDTVLGIELHDSEPWGIDQLRAEHDDLRAVADRYGFVMVSGTNIHGWGRVATAWTLLRIPGWRGMAPPELGAAIERVLRSHGPGEVRVVERAVADPGSSFARLALTLPTATLFLFRTLQAPERLAWLAWAWGGGWLALALRYRRTTVHPDVRDASRVVDPRALVVHRQPVPPSVHGDLP
jgi:hypothetical protein